MKIAIILCLIGSRYTVTINDYKIDLRWLFFIAALVLVCLGM